MNNGTTFTFRHNVLDPVVVEVLIYSRIGRLVKQIKAGELSSRVIEVPWDGNNSSGVPLSSGIYIYRIVCHTADFAMGSEASGKIIVVR
jgi:flagellar hook assembly protein FlgD